MKARAILMSDRVILRFFCCKYCLWFRGLFAASVGARQQINTDEIIAVVNEYRDSTFESRQERRIINKRNIRLNPRIHDQ